MQRSLHRAHGSDWADVAGGWHELWTSPQWERWSIVDELAAGSAARSSRCTATHDDLAPPLHAETMLTTLSGRPVTWVDTSTHDPHRAGPERFLGDLETLWRDAETGIA